MNWIGDPKNIATIEEMIVVHIMIMILDDDWLKVQEIPATVGIPSDLNYHILIEEFCMKNDVLDGHELLRHYQKCMRVHISEQFWPF